MSEKGLAYLVKDGALMDMKDAHLYRCKDCLVGKQHRGSFQLEQTMKIEKLELIHSDVCGTMSM